MDNSDDLFNFSEEKGKMAEEEELQELIDSFEPDDYEPYVWREEIFEMSEELIKDIYNLVKYLLDAPATYQLDSICGGYDDWDEEFMNILFPNIDRKFHIAIVNDEAYLERPSHISEDIWKGIPQRYEYKVKDFAKQDINGKWIPDIDAIRQLEIHYNPDMRIKL